MIYKIYKDDFYSKLKLQKSDIDDIKLFNDGKALDQGFYLLNDSFYLTEEAKNILIHNGGDSHYIWFINEALERPKSKQEIEDILEQIYNNPKIVDKRHYTLWMQTTFVPTHSPEAMNSYRTGGKEVIINISKVKKTGTGWQESCHCQAKKLINN